MLTRDETVLRVVSDGLLATPAIILHGRRISLVAIRG